MTPTDALPKSYDAAAVQEEVAAVWEAERLFHAEPSDPGEPYSIVIPPPNVTAALHLGHALNNTVQDVLIRRARMQGKNAVWLPGTDHAGIATQAVVDKRLQANGEKSLKDYKVDEAEGRGGREAFVAKVQAWKDEYEATILGQLKAMGCSCDFERTAFTMDEPRARAVREAFFRLFKDGLIYRGKRLVNWDPATQTALADDEVEMEEVDGHFYYLKYPVVGGESEVGSGKSEGDESDTSDFRLPTSDFIVVATTRPETMLGDTAVAINPRDPRAASLRGKFVKLPIVGRVIPIVEDDYVVLPDAASDDPKAKYATGLLKVTPAHDPNDWEIGQRHGLPVVNVMAPDGSISDRHGWTDVPDAAKRFVGLDRDAARKQVVEWFRRHDLLAEVRPYRHAVGHSYRSHVPIEPYLSDQWYVAVKKPIPGLPDAGVLDGTDVPRHSLAGLALTALADADPAMRFVPDRYAKTYQQWHEHLRDWCISRQLWWGHRIPVWTCEPESAGVRLSVDEASSTEVMYPKTFSVEDGAVTFQMSVEGDEVVVQRRRIGNETMLFVCPPATASAAESHMTSSEDYTRDSDVLDTWFSSALWPLSTLGWPERTAELTVWNPTASLSTAREIITLWVGRMVMFNRYLLRGEGAEGRGQAAEGNDLPPVTSPLPPSSPGPAPFRDVFIHAMIQDGEGRKMSKSLGNGVDPLDIIATHGADAMRFTLAGMVTQTQDVRLPVERDPATGRNTSPKFDLGRNFCNKVWNAGRFVIAQVGSRKSEVGSGDFKVDSGDDQPSLLDRWILSRLAASQRDANEAIDGYRFDRYATACYDFFWRDFCDWYVEAAKPAMRDPARAAATARVLETCLDAALRLMHPAVPFVTERLWWALNDARSADAADEGNPFRGRPAARCIRADWPAFTPAVAAAIDPDAESAVARLQEVVAAIRTVRNDHRADPKKRLPVTIACPPDVAATVELGREFITTLALADVRAIGDAAPPPDAAKASAGGCEIYVEGVVDRAAESQRHDKRRAELVKQIANMTARLNNPGYADKAPAKLVQQTRDQLAAAEAELATLG